MAVVQVFSGTDEVLLDKAVRDAVKEALGDQSADFALAELTEPDYLVDEQYSIAPLVDAAQTPPMLTDRRVVLGHHLARFSTGDSVEPPRQLPGESTRHHASDPGLEPGPCALQAHDRSAEEARRSAEVTGR